MSHKFAEGQIVRIKAECLIGFHPKWSLLKGVEGYILSIVERTQLNYYRVHFPEVTFESAEFSNQWWWSVPESWLELSR